MFSTVIQITPSVSKISYQDSIMTLGSCFAQNIGNKMADVFFDVDINPFGVLYNPVSIANSIELLLQKKPFIIHDIFEHNSLWQSYSHSSLFSDISVEKCIDKINSRFIKAVEFFKKTDYMMITFGTAWVFENKKSGRVVSNCHKLPANNFVRRRLTVDEIVSEYSLQIIKLQTLFPNLKFIFSVSPIRHWKDGAHENNISKSILLLAIDTLQKQFVQVQYFPAYEIMMDELRDYRFYAPDMLHPSEIAVDYIWKRFSESYFSEETFKINKQIEQLVADRTHRPLHPDSAEFVLFQNNMNKRKEDILMRYPFLSNRID
ncbi:MAG: GSCFA domain-containing protein [Paludibacter sp.]|nr:GSCFA domain-containing protein [Paludibacter sp.]